MTTPNVPIVNAGLLYVNGLQIVNTGANLKTLTLVQGAARDSTNVDDITLSTNLTLNGGVVGPNGVDSAVFVPSTMYAVYVIGDSTSHNATAGLFSLATNATPFLPMGYDMFRRIGWILTDGSSNISLFFQYGNGSSRMYYYNVGITALTAGNATTFTAVNLATSIPPISTQVLFKTTYTPASATNIAQFLPFGSTATNGIAAFGYGAAAAQVGMVTVPSALNSGAPTIQYKVSNSSDSLTLVTAGFIDLL